MFALVFAGAVSSVNAQTETKEVKNTDYNR